MEISKENNFRIIKQANININCYFYGYFKSPGLSNYPNYKWVNEDYDLIKNKSKLSKQDNLRIASNLFLVIKKFNLLANVNHIIMMPLKSTSISNLKDVILTLINLVKQELNLSINLIDNLFLITDYQKFWENRLKLKERKIAIANKIKLKKEYYHFFDNKRIIIIDDVVSTGTSITQVSLEMKKFNEKLNISALTYGSVYQWEKLYC